MADYELVTIENSSNKEVLRGPCQQVTFPLSPDLLDLIAFMKKSVVEMGGVGLAAPQIGQALSIVVVYISEEAKGIRKDAQETIEPTILINPSYRALDKTAMVDDWEGCFSVETVTGKVPRYEHIVYTAFNEQGETIEQEARGFTARVLQHEIDHINGTLIIDKLTKDTIHGHPKDMALLRIQDMNSDEKKLMKKMIEEAINRGGEEERYQDMLTLLDDAIDS